MIFPRSIWLGALWSFLALNSLWAVDPNRLLTQYAHSTWRTQDGAFDGSPVVVTQTTDGYLWIGTNLGLMRFDGVRFSQWAPPDGTKLLDSRVFSLQAARDGSLWIGTGYGISHWTKGNLVNYPQLTGRIEGMLEGDNDAVWLVRNQVTDAMGPLCRIDQEKSQCYGPKDGIPFPLAIQLARGNSGDLWVGGYSELCRWKPGSSEIYFSNGARHPETFASLRAIAAGGDGSIWAAIDRPSASLELEHFTHENWTRRSFAEIKVSNSDITTLFVDREDVLWIGTAHHGLYRARSNAVDHFGSTDGLSSDAVGRFYQDAEGTLWVVTSEGIDNFRDLQVTTYSMREGLSAAGAGSVLAARDGTVWIANFHGLDFLRDGKLSAIRAEQGLPGANITTLFEDHAGWLWLGVDSGLWAYRDHAFRAVRHADGSPLGIVFAITEDIQHNIWVRAGPHLDRIRDFKVQDELTSPQISTAYTLAANPQGGVVLGLVNGDLVEYRDGKSETFPASAAGNAHQIRDLIVDPDGSVWATTLEEIARLKDGVRKTLAIRNGLPCDRIFAFVRDGQGTLWVVAQCGLIAIEQSELQNWWEHPESQVKFKLLDAFDGVQSGLTSLKPQATRSPDGRLWFVNGHLLQMVDPVHPLKNVVLPPVHVELVVADRKNYSQPEHLRLPPLVRDLQIDYTALSFVAPQKVRFRYQLQGHDTEWQEPGTRRQAFYTTLAPGNYRFRVIASNNDGLWNEEGATLDFSIAAAWYQTASFRVLCLAAGLFLVWSVYRLRLRQIAKTMSARFDERLAERNRVAREFHDTLLQTIQGSKMVADDALDEGTDLPRMRSAMEKLSGWLGQAVQEGRVELSALRTSTTQTNDLADSFQRALDDGRMQGVADATFTVEGTAWDMHPIVRHEIYRIGYEAIRNAFQHSGASHIEVGLSYTKDLAFRVSDDGKGIDPEITAHGKKGHFGLQGMRERALRIGGKLSLTSTPAGTRIDLVVPGRIVFLGSRTAWSSIVTRVKRLFGSTKWPPNGQ